MPAIVSPSVYALGARGFVVSNTDWAVYTFAFANGAIVEDVQIRPRSGALYWSLDDGATGAFNAAAQAQIYNTIPENGLYLAQLVTPRNATLVVPSIRLAHSVANGEIEFELLGGGRGFGRGPR